jgi:hypothetical protein
MKGTISISKHSGVSVHLEIDFSTLPRNIQKFVPLQKLEIKGQISKVPSANELRSTTTAFEITSFFKDFTLGKNFDFKDAKFLLGVKTGTEEATKFPFLKLDSKLVVKLSEPLSFHVEGIVKDQNLIILTGKTVDTWQRPFGIPRLEIKNLISHLEIPTEGTLYYSLDGSLLIFDKNVDIHAEIGDKMTFLKGKLGPIQLSKLTGIYSDSLQNLFSKLPIQIDIKDSSITIANATGFTRQGKQITNGVTLEALSKVTIPKIIEVDNIACILNVQKEEFSSNCHIPQVFKFGPITVKDTIAAVSVSKQFQTVSLLSTSDVFNEFGVKINATVFKREGGAIEYSFHAKPKNFKLSSVERMIDTYFNKINFGGADVYFSTFDQSGKIPKGLSVHASLDLKKSGQFFERIHNITGLEKMGLFARLGPILTGVVDPKQMSFGGYADVQFRKLKHVESGSLSVFFGVAPPSVHFKGSVTIVLPRTNEKLKFTGEFSMKTTGMLEAHATLQSSWNPFGLKFVKVNHAALALGIHPAVVATTGMPSMIGAAGSFTWPTLGDLDFGLLVDTIDAGQCLFHAKFQKISTSNILALINKNFAKSIPDVTVSNVIIHVAPAGGRIGEIQFERGFYIKGELEVAGKTLLQAAVKIDDTGFHGAAKLATISFGKFLKIEGVEFEVAMTQSIQRLYFQGQMTLLGVSKRLLVDFSVDGIKFETSLQSNYFSYSIVAHALGSMRNPDDFVLKIQWDISMISKFENHIKSLLRIKMNLVAKLREQLLKLRIRLQSLKNKLIELGNKLRNLVCSVPGIREICNKLRGEIKETESQISPAEREMMELNEKLAKLRVSEFLRIFWDKLSIRKGYFSINLSSLVSGGKPKVNVDFETVISSRSNSLQLREVDPENPFNQEKEQDFVESLVDKY